MKPAASVKVSELPLATAVQPKTATSAYKNAAEVTLGAVPPVLVDPAASVSKNETAALVQKMICAQTDPTFVLDSSEIDVPAGMRFVARQ